MDGVCGWISNGNYRVLGAMGERMTINLDEITKALAEATQGKNWALAFEPGKHIIIGEAVPGGKPIVVLPNRGGVGYCQEVIRARGNLIAHAPEWLRLLVERVRKLELDVMRIDVVLEAAKAVVEDGEYDVHYESRSAALIDSGLLLRLENAVKALSVKEST